MEEPLIPLPPERRLDASGIKWIFVGALVIIFSFRVNGFDIFPNFVGYILVCYGLRQLEEYHPLLRKAKIFAAANLMLSLPEIYSVQYPLGAAPAWLRLTR